MNTIFPYLLKYAKNSDAELSETYIKIYFFQIYFINFKKCHYYKFVYVFFFFFILKTNRQ